MFKKYNNIVNNADSVNCLSGNNYNYNKSKYKNSIVSVNINNNFGYNLIILSVIILMMGALMTATISYYDINNISRRTKNTQDKFKVIHTALISYLAKHGKFPCPAPLDCNSTGCNNDTKKILGKEFRKNKDCISDNYGVFESTNEVGDKLLYGNVPAISLGLDNSYLIDDWGNKLVYIVPDEITKDDALKDISPLKEYVADGKLFVLLSNGANTSGAFPFESRISNSFNEEIIYNLPKANFEVNISDPNYLKYYKNIDVEISEPDCKEITLTYKINIKTETENRECSEYRYTTREPKVFKIPDNAKRLKIEVYGAGGGHTVARVDNENNYNSKGGKGGYSYGILEINKDNLEELGIGDDRKLYLYVGEKGHNSPLTIKGEYDDTGQEIKFGDGLGGWNGGGSGASHNSTSGDFNEGGGGGASDVRTVGGAWDNSASLNSRIIIAGGGGGASRVGKGVVDREEKGGDGAGGIGEGEEGRHKFGGNASGHNTKTQMPGLGGGQTDTNDRGETVTCNVKGGGTLKGGGGYFAGGSTFCKTKTENDRFIDSCAKAKSSYSYDNECGGGGGGSSFIHKAFSDAGGQSGIVSGNGKIRICVILENNNTENNNTISKEITFPKAKYGELSFPLEFVCPSSVTTPTTKISDYYTLSTFKDKNSKLIINNKPAIKCGKNGEWETNDEDGSIKMIYKCEELPKCERPSDVDDGTDWGNFNFKVVNTGQVESADHTKKMQCIVNKKNEASWHVIKLK